MSEILCITNRRLCREDFFTRLEQIARSHPAGIILREKDLSPEEYLALGARALEICAAQGTPCILHGFLNAAIRLKARALHLPLAALERLSQEDKARFEYLGASCHSLEDAKTAQALGAHYIILGNIFETDCKKGLPGRGLEFLREVCRETELPVYAVGGINAQNLPAVIDAGAKGACIMSGFALCPAVGEFMARLKKA